MARTGGRVLSLPHPFYGTFTRRGANSGKVDGLVQKVKKACADWEHFLEQKPYKDLLQKSTSFSNWKFKCVIKANALDKDHLSALEASSVMSLVAVTCGRKGVWEPYPQQSFRFGVFVLA